jgi:hypothetical protein
MTVAPVLVHIDLLAMSRTTLGDSNPPGTWVAVAVAVALMLGRVLLSLAILLLKVLVLLAIVAAIFAIGFEVGVKWDAATGALSPATTTEVPPTTAGRCRI